MKRRWKRIFAGLLAALALCLCPCFAGAAPSEDLPAVKTFQYATSGMCIEEFNRYQLKETARGRFAWIELHNDDHYVLPLTDGGHGLVLRAGARAGADRMERLS